VYQQTDKARIALDDAFSSAVPDDEVLFELTVTKTWLRQVMVGLPLICRSSYRGVVEFLRDLLGVPISIGTVHRVLQLATQQAGVVNRDQDLSSIRVGLHDEIFQGAMPVLAGVDAASTYCYLLSLEEHRDADTWGVHLLDASRQGLKPDYTIADAGQGLRAGQKAAWGGTPCHGDVFFTSNASAKAWPTRYRASRKAPHRGARSWRPRSTARASGIQTTISFLGWSLHGRLKSKRLGWHAISEYSPKWLSHDVLALAGPTLGIRQVLFDFLVEALAHREPEDVRRIRPVRVALQNQRDDLLAFAGVLDVKLADIAQPHVIPEPLVREACVLHRLPSPSSVYWQGWNQLRAKTGGKFHTLFDAVSCAMEQTPRSSSPVENLNSRLRNYFTLRRHLGGLYLGLLQFFLHHQCFMRSRLADRNGKSPQELMAGQAIRIGLRCWALGHCSPGEFDAGRLAASRTGSRSNRNPALAGRRFPRASVTHKRLILNHADIPIVRR
jgi:hypothetical protein